MSKRTIVAVVLALTIVMLAAGCAKKFEVRLEDGGAPLTGAQAERLAATTDISALSSVTTTEAVAMRVKVLGELRTRGALGTRAADLLTIGFPARTAAVPVLVRASKVDGVDAVVVVEAFGSSGGGTLVHRRLWVFDQASGAILRAASVR